MIAVVWSQFRIGGHGTKVVTDIIALPVPFADWKVLYNLSVMHIRYNNEDQVETESSVDSFGRCDPGGGADPDGFNF